MMCEDVAFRERLSQSQAGNFGRRIEAEREDQCSNSPVDIGISVLFGYQAGKVTRRMLDRDKMMRQIGYRNLSAMRVTAQSQIDAPGGIEIVDHVRTM